MPVSHIRTATPKAFKSYGNHHDLNFWRFFGTSSQRTSTSHKPPSHMCTHLLRPFPNWTTYFLRPPRTEKPNLWGIRTLNDLLCETSDDWKTNFVRLAETEQPTFWEFLKLSNPLLETGEQYNENALRIHEYYTDNTLGIH